MLSQWFIFQEVAALKVQATKCVYLVRMSFGLALFFFLEDALLSTAKTEADI